MNPRLVTLFESYADFHRHPINQLTHKIAIPLIVFHIIAMLGWIRLLPLAAIPGGYLTAAHLAYFLAIGWYFTMDAKLAVVMAFLFALCFPIAQWTSTATVIWIAVLGWVIQLAGHVVWEKRAPAFLTNIFQTLIGPLFFVAVLTGRWKTPSVTKT